MTELLMFEVNVKNVTEGRRGPAQVWGSDIVEHNQWTRTKVSSSCSLLLFRKTCQIFANLCIPLWRALASKQLNRLSSFTPFYKWEAMMNLHILSDPVSDFWKCPKKGLKKSYLRHFLVPNFAARHAPPSPGITHEVCLVISCSSIWRRLQKLS